MAKIYNIAERLAEKNKKPEIVLDEEHTFKVNTSTEAVLYIMAAVEDGDKNDIKKIDDVLTIALGKEALESMAEYTLSAKMLVMQAVLAAINEQELEEVDLNGPRKSED